MEDINRWISPLSGILSIASSLVVIYLTYVILRFTARPRLRVRIADESVGIHMYAGETVRLRLLLENRGYWYAKPAATNLWVFINVPSAWEPVRVRFGSGLELANNEVRPGKGRTKYLLAKGINIFAREPGEKLEVEVRLPKRAGRYKCRVAVHSENGDDCGVHVLRLRVRKSIGQSAAVDDSTQRQRS